MCKKQTSVSHSSYTIRDYFTGCWFANGRYPCPRFVGVVIDSLHSSNNVPPTQNISTPKYKPEGAAGNCRTERPDLKMVLQTAQEVLDTSQITEALLEPAHPFSSKPDCNSTAEVPSLILRTAQRYHLSRIDEVLRFDDSMIDLHKICQIPKKCECI